MLFVSGFRPILIRVLIVKKSMRSRLVALHGCREPQRSWSMKFGASIRRRCSRGEKKKSTTGFYAVRPLFGMFGHNTTAATGNICFVLDGKVSSGTS